MLLLTGGTGSLGRAYLEFSKYNGRIRILSRDEQKQEKLRGAVGDGPIQLILGDVRDPEKVARAMQGVERVLHAAALKIIPNGAYNPDEFIKTNIQGTANVIHAAQMAGVKEMIFVSTDKGCEPTNFYGATKMVGEHLCVEANRWSETNVSVVRYGNVWGSRGSFVNTLDRLEPKEVVKVTDPECTRFWITKEAAVRFIDLCFDEMEGGEIFVPRLPSKRLGDMIPDGQPIEIIGMRNAGEKLHETLVGADELRRTECKGEYFVIRPWPYQGNCVEQVPYRSDSHEDWGSD
jgi:UDP-N-acetylglucosamine 4,6-dehydratase